MTTNPCPDCGKPREVTVDSKTLPGFVGQRIAPCECAKEKRDE